MLQDLVDELPLGLVVDSMDEEVIRVVIKQIHLVQ